MREKRNFVYVIGHDGPDGISCGPVKVGVTGDPDKRLCQLQTGNPRQLRIICVFEFPNREIALGVERAFHTVMAPDAMEGEWFNMPIVPAVKAMCENVRVLLRTVGFSGEEFDLHFLRSGAWHAEMRATEELVRNTWECSSGPHPYH